MLPTEVLKHEHQVILLVLGAAEREAQQIEATGAAHAETVDEMVDFFRSFADGCHHAKEEKLLFTKMQERGVPVQGGPIAAMLQEHDQGRRLVRAMAEALPGARAGDGIAIAAVKDNLRTYAGFLRAHIAKEDNILYPMADRLFTPDDQRALGEAFDRLEAEETGEGVHEKYHGLAHKLAGMPA
jgi:hemerythrin-like domain-containing protein